MVKPMSVLTGNICEGLTFSQNAGGADYWYESSMLMQKSLQLNVNEDLEAGQHAVRH